MINTTAEIKLTQDQEIALKQMKNFCSYPDEQFFRLTGYAGTGKSFIICQLIKWLQKQNYQVLACSPTNKAAKNLENIAREANLSNLTITTIAKALGKKAQINNLTGKEEFVGNTDTNILSYHVVICDEFSMICMDDFVDLLSQVEGTKTKIIYVGDPAQLPPVGESKSAIIDHPSIKVTANLTTVVRYEGSVVKVAEEIRSDAAYNKLLYPFDSTEDGSIKCLPEYDWLDAADALFNSQEYRLNPNHVRFLVWRNRTALELNEYVRHHLWGSNAPAYVPGDRLIAKSPVFRIANAYLGRGKTKNVWKTVLSSSEECEVLEESKITYDENYGYQYYQVPVITDDGMTLNLRILTSRGIRGTKKIFSCFEEE